MVDAHLRSKTIETADIKNLIIGGQTGIDGIRFCLAAVTNGENLADPAFAWFLQYKNKNGQGEAVGLTPVYENGLVKLPWVPNKLATQVPGRMQIQLYAAIVTGEGEASVVDKQWVSEFAIIYIQENLNPEPIIATELTIFDQYLTMYQSYRDASVEAFQGISDIVNGDDFQTVLSLNNSIPAVATMNESIPVVAEMSVSVPLVAGVKDEIPVLAPVVSQIEQLALIKDQIVSLEAEKLKVAAVEAKLSEIQAVHEKLTEIEGVYGKSVEIDALYAQLKTIAEKANQADLDSVTDLVTTIESTLNNILIGQDLDPNKDIEVLGARVSPITGSHTTIGGRMTEAEKIMKFQSQADYVSILSELCKPVKTEYLKNHTELAIINTFRNGKTIVDTFQLNEPDAYILCCRTGFMGGAIGVVSQTGGIASRTGTWGTAYSPNNFTAQVGATFTNSLKGNWFVFRYYADNRGGIWKFEVDGVVVASKSVWNATVINSGSFIFGSDSIDPDETHTIVATFMGDDPLHEPSEGVGTARGWVKDDASTNNALSAMIYSSEAKNIINDHSNRDFAFLFKYNGVSTWTPYHTIVSLTQIDEPKFFIDGIEYTKATIPSFTQTEFSNIAIEQHFYSVISATNVAEFWHRTTVSQGVISFSIKMKALKECVIENGYCGMLAAQNGTLETIVSSMGESHHNLKDNSNTVLDDSHRIGNSFIAIDSTNKNLAVAVTLDYPMRTNRMYNSDTATPFLWNNPTQYLKLYNHIFKNASISAGEEWGGNMRFSSVSGDGLFELFS